MIPVANTVEQIDTLPGEEIEFSIGDPRWVMRTQADLYSNREGAVTREYATNARDAMVESGRADQPIEVTLPSLMHPYYKVRDFGDGMDLSTLTKTYTQFGSSTKRSSNDTNGMLGYGSKSALAYTDTFTVTSIHNGIKHVAVVVRKADWSIIMKVVHSAPTDEASGTEIVVPVHNVNEFAQKAQDFFRFWIPGTVLVNDEFPIQDVGEKITDGLYYSTDNGYRGTSYVVMGNVGYRIANPDALFQNSRMDSINFVAYVDNGDVEFTPSREDLKYTEHTKATLVKVIRDFEDKIIIQANKEISAATDHFDAYSKYMEWTNKLGKGLFSELEYDGDKLVTTFDIKGTRYRVNAYGYSTQRINNWNISEMDRTLIVTGFTPNLSSHHKTKAREYANLVLGMSARYVLFTEQSKIDSVWIDHKKVVNWEDLKAALPKKPKKARVYTSGPTRIPGTFDYWTRNGWFTEKEIPEDKTVYFIRVQEDKGVKARAILETMNDDGVVIVLAANRITKFTRDNPDAIDFLPYFKAKVVKDGKTLLNDEAKKMLAIGTNTQHWLEKFNVSKINDPAFVKMKDMLKRREDLTAAYDKNLTLAQSLGMWYDVTRHEIRAHDETTLVPYPLLDSLRHQWSMNMDHVYIYLNAAYAARKDK